MMSDESSWCLFFLHDRQIPWLAPLAETLALDADIESELWVVGESDYALGETERGYSRVLNILDGFDPNNESKPILDVLDNIREFEERYSSLRINQSAAIDRNLHPMRWSRDRIVRYASHLLERMEDRIHDNGSYPVFLLGENNSLRYRLAHGIIVSESCHYMPLNPRYMLDRYYISDAQSERWTDCVDTYTRFSRNSIPGDSWNYAMRLRDRIVDEHRAPEYSGISSDNTKLTDIINPVTVFESLFRYLKMSYHFNDRVTDPTVSIPSELRPTTRFRIRLAKIRRQRAFYQIASDTPPDSPYATYFLHVRPEYNVDGRAFPFRKQETVIENIAAALPADMALAVKEHTPMVGKRPVSYYNNLREAPNIDILAADVDNFELVQNASIVFTLVGTVALEAMAFGVPSVIFSDVYFSTFEGIHKAESLNQLPELVDKLLSDPDAGATTQQALKAFASMHAASHPGSLGDPNDPARPMPSQTVNQLSLTLQDKLSSCNQ